MEYDEDLKIDENNLEAELVKQASLYFYYAKLQVEAAAEMEYAKERQQVKASELDGLIRLSPEDYGVEKVSENAVKAAILIDEDYQDLVKAGIEARTNEGLYRAATTALTHKKSALESLVRLQLSKMNSEPYAAGQVGEDIKQTQKKKKGK